MPECSGARGDINSNRHTFDAAGLIRYHPFMNSPKALDLRKQYPRSPHEDLGGYVIFPRIIDKCRALLAGTNGEYNYNCPLDRQFFDFTSIDADALKAEAAKGKSDEELLEFVRLESDPHTESEILCWSFEQRQRGPELYEQKVYFEQARKKFAPKHPSLAKWFDLLDAEEGRVR